MIETTIMAYILKSMGIETILLISILIIILVGFKFKDIINPKGKFTIINLSFYILVLFTFLGLVFYLYGIF